MTSGSEASCASAPSCSRMSSFERSISVGRTTKRSPVMKAVIRTSFIAREQAEGRDRGHAGDQGGEHAKGEDERQGTVGEEIHRHPSEPLQVDGAHGMGGDGEDPDRGEAEQETVGPGEPPLEDRQGLEERLLPLDSHERHPQDGAEQDDRGNHAVGQGMEWVRRNVQGEEVDARRVLDEGRAEEGRVLDGGKREGHEEHRPQGEGPQHERQGSHVQEEPGRSRRVEAPDSRDQGHGDVGQDRHLEQADERVGEEAEGLGPLAQEEPQRQPQPEADQDLGGEAHRRGGSLAPGSIAAQRHYPPASCRRRAAGAHFSR